MQPISFALMINDAERATAAKTNTCNLAVVCMFSVMRSWCTITRKKRTVHNLTNAEWLYFVIFCFYGELLIRHDLSFRGLEKRTCHWGFDRDNWRFYIFVPDHLEKRKYMEMKEELKEIKEKFSFSPKIEESQHRISPNTIKRRIVSLLKLSCKSKSTKDLNY